MPAFTALIRLEHKPHFGFVIRRGQYVEMMPTSSFTQEQLNEMTTYYVPLQKYGYMYPNGHEFHSLDEISEYVNN